MFCSQIRSDKEQLDKVRYSLTGVGADQPPYNLFVVNPVTGFVRITDMVDREKYPSYNVSISFNAVTGLRFPSVTVLYERHQAPTRHFVTVV